MWHRKDGKYGNGNRCVFLRSELDSLYDRRSRRKGRSLRGRVCHLFRKLLQVILKLRCAGHQVPKELLFILHRPILKLIYSLPKVEHIDRDPAIPLCVVGVPHTSFEIDQPGDPLWVSASNRTQFFARERAPYQNRVVQFEGLHDPYYIASQVVGSVISVSWNRFARCAESFSSNPIDVIVRSQVRSEFVINVSIISKPR